MKDLTVKEMRELVKMFKKVHCPKLSSPKSELLAFVNKHGLLKKSEPEMKHLVQAEKEDILATKAPTTALKKEHLKKAEEHVKMAKNEEMKHLVQAKKEDILATKAPTTSVTDTKHFKDMKNFWSKVHRDSDYFEKMSKTKKFELYKFLSGLDEKLYLQVSRPYLIKTYITKLENEYPEFKSKN